EHEHEGRARSGSYPRAQSQRATGRPRHDTSRAPMTKTRHIHALFESPDAAAAAYAAIQTGGCVTDHCSAILHQKHLDESGLTTDERAGREGARDGAMVAGTTGAVIGGLAALGGGLLGVGPLAAAAF